MLKDEVRRLQRELDKAMLDIKDREDECARLRSLVDKLRNGMDTFKADFGSTSVFNQTSIRNYYIEHRGSMIERIISMRNRANGKLVKELILRILQLNKDMAKQKKYYEDLNGTKSIAVRAPKKKDPLYIWTQVRLRLTSWLFELFVRSRDESMKYKK